jgi:endonuclease/exonuclease/phosphatase family metal-dependent hydrolase
MRLKSLGSLLCAVAVMLALPALPARADTVLASSAPPLRFVSYNMCGNMCSDKTKFDVDRRIDYIVSQADVTTWNADEFFLQEVCRSQYNEILSRLQPKGFSGLYAPTVTGVSSVCSGGDYGLAALVRGSIVQSTILHLTQGDEKEHIDAPCVESYVQNRANWACSVHLYWDDPALTAAEASELAAQAKTWQDSGIPVVLGGDFNASPLTTPLSSFYNTSLPGGTGSFLEADQTDQDYFFHSGCDPAQVTSCRSGDNTFKNFDTGVEAKIDYIFFSDQYFKDIQGDVQPLDTKLSDHRLYRGAASWADCGQPGANQAGVIRRDVTGALFRYSGRPDGTIAPACKVGTGWGIMQKIVRHGDFDGNGSEDLLAVDGDGNLWLYPADGAGVFSGSTRRQIGTGWQIYNTLLAPGDFNGDGKADLIGRDDSGDLWFYAGDGTGGYAARVKIGYGWQIYTALLAPGDFNGDGKADLIGRDSSGNLWFYAGDGTGGYAARTNIGTGWQIYDALVAAGDVNGDGKADLIGRDSSGNLWFYAGNGAAGYAPRTQIGYSFPAGELLF